MGLLLYNTLIAILTILDFDENGESIEIKEAIGQLMSILYLTTPMLTLGIIIFKLLRDIYYLFLSDTNNQSSINHIQLSQLDSENTETMENVQEKDFDFSSEANMIEPYVFDE